jgi:amino acid transporter
MHYWYALKDQTMQPLLWTLFFMLVMSAGLAGVTLNPGWFYVAASFGMLMLIIWLVSGLCTAATHYIFAQYKWATESNAMATRFTQKDVDILVQQSPAFRALYEAKPVNPEPPQQTAEPLYQDMRTPRVSRAVPHMYPEPTAKPRSYRGWLIAIVALLTLQLFMLIVLFGNAANTQDFLVHAWKSGPYTSQTLIPTGSTPGYVTPGYAPPNDWPPTGR